MVLNNCLNNIRNFLNFQTPQKQSGMFRVTVVAFEDKCTINCGKIFADLLKRNNLFSVNYFSEPFAKNFLNLQSRNFFDFIDRGKQILSSTHSDIIIWGYEENNHIRLNFQIEQQYAIPEATSFSLLDSLFIPLSYFDNPEKFSEPILLLIFGIIIAAIRPITNEQIKNKPQLLKDILALLSSDTSAKDISVDYMPFIMNMLGKIYLCNAAPHLTVKDIEIISNLSETALKNTHLTVNPLYYGGIYNSLGQLYETAFNNDNLRSFEYLKSAISHYQDAHKYYNRNYPYDFGRISYHLALLYFEYWKHNSDVQALRDAVSRLREAEKVYTYAQFKDSWHQIQKLLGYYMTTLGNITGSNEIMHLAIDSYRNQQTIYLQNVYPMEWSKIQEQIGHVYYLLGKQNDDDNFMYEARNYFNSALEIYTQLKNKEAQAEVCRRLAKLENYID